MKLVSLNIEQGKHYGKNILWLKEQEADVICLQEIKEKDILEYSRELGFGHFYFESMFLSNGIHLGLGFFSHSPIKNIQVYSLGERKVDDVSIEAIRASETNWKLLVVKTECESSEHTFGVIHAPIGYPGSTTTNFQKEGYKKLKHALARYSSFVMCGDLNAARGLEIYDSLAHTYTDWIPREYATSIDNSLHRDGALNLQYVVDCLFTTNDYVCENVDYTSGLSDHLGLTANVTKRDKTGE